MKLSQKDLFSCFKGLVSIHFIDARLYLLKGLSKFIQDCGNLFALETTGGWVAIFEILSSIPYSMTSESFQTKWNLSQTENSFKKEISQEYENSLDSEPFLPSNYWPKETLHDAFGCVVLIVDEYSEKLMPKEFLIENLICCLALYSAQKFDINISLTALELLWKISDSKIKLTNNNSNNHQIFNIMLFYLFQLSFDKRAEIRHCSINTLFTAISAYANLIMSNHWFDIFKFLIQPLFDRENYKELLNSRYSIPYYL